MSLMTVEKSFVGTYRGSIIDHGVAETTGGFPQWIAALHGLHYYDEQEKTWIDLSEYDEVDITAYLVLAGREQKEIFHCKNIEKAVGWDGQSWSSLAAMDLSETQIQFRVEEHTYNENVTLQVAGVDHYDAEPGRRVQKLDAKDLKTLDAKFSTFFRKRKGERKPVKPVGKPVIPNKAKAREEAPAETDESKPDLPSPDSDAPPKAPKKTAKTAKPKKGKGITQGDAWKACKKAKDESISDKQLADIWLQTVETLAPDGDEDQMTPELWVRVKDIVVEQVSGAEVAHL